ncbi:MAG: hypothetical protein ACLFNU_03635 [Bacteroidales bacterium]
MESIWYVLALLCLALAIYATIKQGISESYMFFILSAVAALMGGIRMYRRKHHNPSN